ncbi:hypothetical protein DFQ26_008378 [Actinomortierella ambigua]|nr:hypothetical protein DFQ26_008378 [Actinomortierella ambigua]
MTTDILTLLCLGDGEATSNAFSVKICSDKSVSHLKQSIKATKTRSFDNVTTDKLTLWRVTISAKDADNTTPVLLDNFATGDKEKLEDPWMRLSALFSEDRDENTYILVQRSQPDSSPQLKCIWLGDDIERELAIILSDVGHHHSIYDVDQKDAEALQRKRLGRFFKRTLPCSPSTNDVSLVMLGLQLGKQARTSTGETLHSIIERNIGLRSIYSLVAMVAPSGSGKTATIVDLATKHFVVYCVCSTADTCASPDFHDPNFITLTEEIEKSYLAVSGNQQGDLLEIDFHMKIIAQQRIEIEFLARLLFLQLLIDHDPELPPQQFFRAQMTPGGASSIRKLVDILRKYEITTIHSMLDRVQRNLHSILVRRGVGLVIAVDDAQVAEQDILFNKLISGPALIHCSPDKMSIFDDTDQVLLEHRRSFFTVLRSTLSHLQATLVILGTTVSLLNVDNTHFCFGDTTNFVTITDFPWFDENDIHKMLSGLVDLSDCEIPPAKRRRLSGRPRFSLGIIEHLLETGHRTLPSTQAPMDIAIEH